MLLADLADGFAFPSAKGSGAVRRMLPFLQMRGGPGGDELGAAVKPGFAMLSRN